MRPFAFCRETGDEREPWANILHHPWPAPVAFPRFHAVSPSPRALDHQRIVRIMEISTSTQPPQHYLPLSLSPSRAFFLAVPLASIRDYRG